MATGSRQAAPNSQKVRTELADRQEDIPRQDCVENKEDMIVRVSFVHESSVDDWRKDWIRQHYIEEDSKKFEEAERETRKEERRYELRRSASEEIRSYVQEEITVEYAEGWILCRGLGMTLSLSWLQWARAHVHFQLFSVRFKEEDEHTSIGVQIASCRPKKTKQIGPTMT